jgi:DNA primase small subunit
MAESEGIVDVEMKDEGVGEEEKEERGGDSSFDKDKLRQYYELFFPYKEMTKWLSYFCPKESTMGEEDRATGRVASSKLNNSKIEYFSRREFSFTLQNEIYCRYLSFPNEHAFHHHLVNNVPYKIDIGALFNIEVYFIIYIL